MRTRDYAGLSLIMVVLAVSGWFITVSPGDQVALRAAVRDRPSAIACAWSQPWTDSAYAMIGWSQPQAWWHKPGTKVLWSNARQSEIVFHAPTAAEGMNIDIEYVAVSAPVDVLINGKRAGALDRGADGDRDPHVFRYHLSPVSDDGLIDIRFLTHDAVLHYDDGRYLGVLLQAVRYCPTNNVSG